MSDSTASDRREAALVAAYDHPKASEAAILSPKVRAMLTAAVESATRVEITHDVIVAFMTTEGSPDDIDAPLRAAFRAAGFEVME